MRGIAEHTHTPTYLFAQFHWRASPALTRQKKKETSSYHSQYPQLLLQIIQKVKRKCEEHEGESWTEVRTTATKKKNNTPTSALQSTEFHSSVLHASKRVVRRSERDTKMKFVTMTPGVSTYSLAQCVPTALFFSRVCVCVCHFRYLSSLSWFFFCEDIYYYFITCLIIPVHLYFFVCFLFFIGIYAPLWEMPCGTPPRLPRIYWFIPSIE